MNRVYLNLRHAQYLRSVLSLSRLSYCCVMRVCLDFGVDSTSSSPFPFATLHSTSYILSSTIHIHCHNFRHSFSRTKNNSSQKRQAETKNKRMLFNDIFILCMVKCHSYNDFISDMERICSVTIRIVGWLSHWNF